MNQKYYLENDLATQEVKTVSSLLCYMPTLYISSGNICYGAATLESPNKSPPQRVPSPMTPSDSPSQVGIYSSENCNPTFMLSNGDDENFTFQPNQV